MNKQDTIGAINDRELDDIFIQLNNDIDSISDMLAKIQMNFYDTKDYFTGTVADSIRTKFEFYEKQIPTIKKNLETYANDLIAIKSLMGEIDVNSAMFLEEVNDDTKAKTTSVLDEVKKNNDSLYVNTTTNLPIRDKLS